MTSWPSWLQQLCLEHNPERDGSRVSLLFCFRIVLFQQLLFLFQLDINKITFGPLPERWQEELLEKHGDFLIQRLPSSAQQLPWAQLLPSSNQQQPSSSAVIVRKTRISRSGQQERTRLCRYDFLHDEKVSTESLSFVSVGLGSGVLYSRKPIFRTLGPHLRAGRLFWCVTVVISNANGC